MRSFFPPPFPKPLWENGFSFSNCRPSANRPPMSVSRLLLPSFPFFFSHSPGNLQDFFPFSSGHMKGVGSRCGAVDCFTERFHFGGVWGGGRAFQKVEGLPRPPLFHPRSVIKALRPFPPHGLPNFGRTDLYTLASLGGPRFFWVAREAFFFLAGKALATGLRPLQV